MFVNIILELGVIWGVVAGGLQGLAADLAGAEPVEAVVAETACMRKLLSLTFAILKSKTHFNAEFA
ncbi:hypothetical protein LPB67_07825 [Undibacterium sp. Jales W-56]|uniref:hypothetical protein n=1 Tax=Undibacterium sp. Jales W-56 TaxID=2897325 RepID=UPI0021D3749C|nr:hypothetical protein [Undibacterium sp. Jales W-56]MCU6433686.1 hypothetical protein [Undibacterium sp. Jales W-56]